VLLLQLKILVPLELSVVHGGKHVDQVFLSFDDLLFGVFVLPNDRDELLLFAVVQELEILLLVQVLVHVGADLLGLTVPALLRLQGLIVVEAVFIGCVVVM